MKNLLAIAGAAAFAFAGPAYAKPGHGHENNSHAAHQSGKGKRGVVVSDRYGRLYALNARGTCPPGLAKKGNGCMPPGQARKRWNTGQRWNDSYGTRWSYNQIPYDWRQQYNLDPNDRYYYRDGYVYRVDNRTRLVEQVLSAILR